MRIGFWSKIGKVHAPPTKVRIFQLFCTYWNNVDKILLAFFISCAKQTKTNEIGMQKVEHSSLCEWANLMIAKTSSVAGEKGSNNLRKSSTPLLWHPSQWHWSFVYTIAALLYFQVWSDHDCCSQEGKCFWWPAQKVFLSPYTMATHFFLQWSNIYQWSPYQKKVVGRFGTRQFGTKS